MALELVNKSEVYRDRAFNVLGRKHRNIAGCLTLTKLALEAHTIRNKGEWRDVLKRPR